MSMNKMLWVLLLNFGVVICLFLGSCVLMYCGMFGFVCHNFVTFLYCLKLSALNLIVH